MMGNLYTDMSKFPPNILVRKVWTLSHVAKAKAFASGSEVLREKEKKQGQSTCQIPSKSHPWLQGMKPTAYLSSLCQAGAGLETLSNEGLLWQAPLGMDHGLPGEPDKEAEVQLVGAAHTQSCLVAKTDRGKGGEGVGQGVGGASGQQSEKRRADEQNKGAPEWLSVQLPISGMGIDKEQEGKYSVIRWESQDSGDGQLLTLLLEV